MYAKPTMIALVAGALVLGAWAGWPGLEGAVDSARAQSVSVLSDADVDLRHLGRLEGTAIVYVEFADGARCLVSNNGTGDVDCDW